MLTESLTKLVTFLLLHIWTWNNSPSLLSACGRLGGVSIPARSLWPWNKPRLLLDLPEVFHEWLILVLITSKAQVSMPLATTHSIMIDWNLSSDFSYNIISPEWEIFTVTIKIMKVNFKWHSNSVTWDSLPSPGLPLHSGSSPPQRA